MCARGRIARINSIKRDLTVIIIIRALSLGSCAGRNSNTTSINSPFFSGAGFHGLRITFSFAFCSFGCVCVCFVQFRPAGRNCQCGVCLLGKKCGSVICSSWVIF